MLKGLWLSIFAIFLFTPSPRVNASLCETAVYIQSKNWNQVFDEWTYWLLESHSQTQFEGILRRLIERHPFAELFSEHQKVALYISSRIAQGNYLKETSKEQKIQITKIFLEISGIDKVLHSKILDTLYTPQY